MAKIWKETKKALETMKEGQIVMQVKGGKLTEPINDLLDSGGYDWTGGGGLKKKKGRR